MNRIVELLCEMEFYNIHVEVKKNVVYDKYTNAPWWLRELIAKNQEELEQYFMLKKRYADGEESIAQAIAWIEQKAIVGEIPWELPEETVSVTENGIQKIVYRKTDGYMIDWRLTNDKGRPVVKDRGLFPQE